MDDFTLAFTGFCARLGARVGGKAGSMAFDAFLSYSHAADGRLAPALQRAIQRFAKPWYRTRALRVFRDESALSANPHLWSSIQTALDESDWFVLLASPDAVDSEWVNRELDHWLKTKSRDRILVVLTDGTWEWDSIAHKLTGSAVPPVLRDAFADEPRHVDLRWARAETDLDMHNARFREGAAQLAAPLRGIPKDELESEDILLHRRARRLARGATSLLIVLLVLALVLGGVALQQRSEARHQAASARRQRDIARREAIRSLGGDLVSKSLDALRSGRNDLALLLAVEAEHTEPNLSSKSNLLSALLDQPSLERQLHGLSHTTTALAFSPDGHLFTASDGEQLKVWDVHSGQPLAPQPNLSSARFADHGRLLVGKDRSGLVVTDVATGRVLQRVPSPSAAWAVSTDAPILAAADEAGIIEVWDIRRGKQVASITTDRPHGEVAISPDGASVAVVSSDTRAWNVATGRPLGPGCATGLPTNGDVLLNLDVLPDGRTVHMVTQSGSSALIARCHADTGASEPRKKIDLPSFVHSIYRADMPLAVDAVAPDDHTVAARDIGGTIQVVDSAEGFCSSFCGTTVRAPYSAQTSSARTVVFSPDSHYFAATEDSGDVRIWRTSPDSTLYQVVDTVSNPDQCCDQVVSSPSRRVAITSRGDIIDARTHQRLGHLPDGPTSMSLSADGRLLAASTSNALTVVDLQRHTSHTLRTEGPACTSVAPAISDRLVVLGCSGPASAPSTAGVIRPIDISSWPWRTGNPVSVATTVPIGSYTALEFSPDGTVLAVFGGDTLQFVDVDRTGLHPRPPTHQSVAVSVFTPDSRTLVVDQGTGNGLVELVPVRPGDGQSTVLSLTAQTAVCTGGSDCAHPTILGVSPDGRLLATAAPGSVHVWDLSARQLIGVIPVDVALLGVGLNTSQLTITDTSLTIDEGYGSGLMVDLDPASWARQACTIADRNLTRAEWTEFVGSSPYRKQCPALP
jgi:WD40 repeat protein